MSKMTPFKGISILLPLCGAYPGGQGEVGWRKPEGMDLLLENGEKGAFYESGIIMMLPINTFLVFTFQA